MFTGIITATGKVMTSRKVPKGRALTISGGWDVHDYELGESIAIDGACLTVIDFQDSKFQVEVSSESVDLTTLGSLKRGSVVNLERALKVGDRLGGHFVTGHVDGVGSVAAREPSGEGIRVHFALPRGLMRYVISKGSIAVDGISLTINRVNDAASSVEVMIVPHTQLQTTLQTKGPGASVNIEVDMLGKYVERFTASGVRVPGLVERGSTAPAKQVPMDPTMPPEPDGL
ncbi:MAG: riboflavin synthase [Proteobacteria bacterium]|nr:riboflavin synthase [Pseudomonadota bacterium]